MYDVIGIGNAVMDVIAPLTDEGLAALAIEKGVMQLIDQSRAEALTQAQRNARLMPGGSVANTLDGIGRLGLRTAFIGRVAHDDLGLAYAAQTIEAGTDFVNTPVSGDLPTSRSLIFVTPDGERSMNTYLGVSAELGPDDVDPAIFAGAGWLFLEGYLFDKDQGKAAFLKAAQACHDAGGQAGIALSDPFCVDRHRDDFRRLIAGPMDYVIGNRREWMALYQTDDLDTALTQAQRDCRTVICTRSGDPALLLRDDERVEIPVHPVTPVDATGAGDQFAAGLIAGLARNLPLEVAGQMAVLAAAEVISHVGARSQSDLLARFRSLGLI